MAFVVTGSYLLHGGRRLSLGRCASGGQRAVRHLQRGKKNPFNHRGGECFLLSGLSLALALGPLLGALAELIGYASNGAASMHRNRLLWLWPFVHYFWHNNGGGLSSQACTHHVYAGPELPTPVIRAALLEPSSIVFSGCSSLHVKGTGTDERALVAGGPRHGTLARGCPCSMARS